MPSLSRTITNRTPGSFQAFSFLIILFSKSCLPSWARQMKDRPGNKRGRRISCKIFIERSSSKKQSDSLGTGSFKKALLPKGTG
ncbi:MAG: hypothetical protein OMM_07811 [Candidatus Magnetoglobus multicellularis str. Araruama]|uniref:Uncharacterized protein n=1 Tax=Candidatus Magnetoglobus multicellularis str. Araruama TaxID=890399 RepID=A0A1V1PAM9_9BACT|nr:MAG: hypothetical protein OMM_07811 [Candidatus Magnetoglobus multicellularis str. Araruama]